MLPFSLFDICHALMDDRGRITSCLFGALLFSVHSKPKTEEKDTSMPLIQIENKSSEIQTNCFVTTGINIVSREF